jgi:ABC-type lipoprotein export system ATPase subunit
MPPLLSLQNVSKTVRDAAGRDRHILSAVSAAVEPGQIVAVMGRSGSGKSTLLNLIAGIDRPSGGTIRLFDRDLERMGERDRTHLRRESIGLVFQFFHLLPHLSVQENVALPALIAGERLATVKPRVQDLLERTGLLDRLDDAVGKLSGGEMQRVAICRALLRRPPLLLADEPTGNLDDETGDAVMAQMLDLVAREGSTLIYVTHSPEQASLAHESWRLHSGMLETTCSATS